MGPRGKRAGENAQRRAVLLLLLVRQTVLGLGELELAVALEGDEADAEIGPAEVERDEVARLGAARVLERAGRSEGWLWRGMKGGETHAEDVGRD